MFRTRQQARVALHTLQGIPRTTSSNNSVGVKQWKVRAAPSCDDIQWNNMYINDSTRRFRRLTANAFLCVTMILIITPSAIIIPIRYLLDIESRSGPIQPNRDLVGVAVPALALFLVNTIILPWLIQISADFQGEFLRSDRERSILAKNALFLFFNALLLPTFSLNSLSSIIDSKYVEHLGDWQRQIGVLFMSSGGQFFMVYLVHAALLGSAADLLNFSGAFWKLVYRHTSITREEFQRIHMTPSYDCGYNLAYQLTMFGLALTYSTAVPLLLPFALFYFVVNNLVTWHLIENNLRIIDNDRLNNIVPSLSLYLFIYCIIFQITVACILVIQTHPMLYACGVLMFVFVVITIAITIWSRQWSQSALLAAITTGHDQSFPTAYRHPLLRTHRLDYDCDL